MKEKNKPKRVNRIKPSKQADALITEIELNDWEITPHISADLEALTVSDKLAVARSFGKRAAKADSKESRIYNRLAMEVFRQAHNQLSVMPEVERSEMLVNAGNTVQKLYKRLVAEEALAKLPPKIRKEYLRRRNNQK